MHHTLKSIIKRYFGGHWNINVKNNPLNIFKGCSCVQILPNRNVSWKNLPFVWVWNNTFPVLLKHLPYISSLMKLAIMLSGAEFYLASSDHIWMLQAYPSLPITGFYSSWPVWLELDRKLAPSAETHVHIIPKQHSANYHLGNTQVLYI